MMHEKEMRESMARQKEKDQQWQEKQEADRRWFQIKMALFSVFLTAVVGGLGVLLGRWLGLNENQQQQPTDAKRVPQPDVK